MRRRTERNLSQGEVALWAHVARSVRPFPGRKAEAPAPEPGPPVKAAPDRTAKTPQAKTSPAKTPPVKAPVPQPTAPALKPLAPLERRLRTDLKRGIQPIEAVIDLHGMRQAEAHLALGAFLQRAHWQGARLVLVVTGKGGAPAGAGDERGVLRRMAPHWLRLPDLRPLVLGFEEAGQRHGGAGALYVRLRRPPGQGEQAR